MIDLLNEFYKLKLFLNGPKKGLMTVGLNMTERLERMILPIISHISFSLFKRKAKTQRAIYTIFLL